MLSTPGTDRVSHQSELVGVSSDARNVQSSLSNPGTDMFLQSEVADVF